MAWKKLGHVYRPTGDLPWARSHAANPVAEHVGGDRFRIYFSARDERNRSSIGSVLIDVNEPTRVLEVAPTPVLAPGELGMFDDCGVSMGCIVHVGEVRYLYYMGWNLAVTVPWKNELGLVISKDPGMPFERLWRFPVLRLDEMDPYTLSYPSVLREGNRFRMWYGSSLRWGSEKADMLHVIKYAESDDGIHWSRTGSVVIDSATPRENVICKPFVVRDPDRYRMWFCSRPFAEHYRIQYAESKDGLSWRRLGEDTGIDVSPSGWDSRSIEFPSVFDHKGRRYLLYSGDDFGKTGFGIAVREP